MSDKSIFTGLKDYQACFDGLVKGNEEDLAAILSFFGRANEARAEWPEDFAKLFQNRLSKYFDGMENRKIEVSQLRLLRAALTARLDSPVLREKYALLAKREFQSYKDPAALVDVLGLSGTEVSLDVVICRWQLLHEIKSAAICYDKALERGCIVALDDAKSEVQMQFAHRRTVSLSEFMSDYIVVSDLSSLHTILSGGLLPAYRDGKDMRRILEDCLVCGGPLPEGILKSILVPAVMSESHYNAQVLGIVEKQTAAPARSDDVAPVSEVRWDESRTVLELSERLKQVTTLNVEGGFNRENVARILTNGKDRSEQAEKFALSIALFLKNADAEMKGWIYSLCESLADACVWKDPAVCIEVSNKIPGKLAQNWFEFTASAVGTQFLAKLVIKLPYRLWTPLEHALNQLKKRDELKAEVEAALATGRVSCDLVYWLWRSGHDELKKKYIGDATLIFKTLHAEVKGDYLKAQRDLRRLLLDDEEFQIMVMRDGDHQAVVDLIRCAKRYPLLDPGEIQSILVKISEIYPEFISDIEEKHKGPTRISISKVTSIRGYNRRVAELQDLVDVQIPENIKAIEHARSLGDLRENSEFKYAKERQRMLGLRRREWEDSLQGLRATDFRDVQINDIIVPGCAVTLKYNDNSTEVFYILGLLDSEPDKHIISYDAPLGKLLIGGSKGARINMPNGAKATVAEVESLSEEMYKYVAGN